MAKRPAGTVSGEPANRIFEQCLLEYGIHSLQSKLPHIIDGLKSVQRRVLITHPTSDTPKVVSITGKVLDKYHPYGDASISSTITKMAQPQNIFVNLMTSDGNIGDYGGGEAAAPRYLEIAASKLTQFVFFENIDHSILDTQPSEVGNGLEEPKYLIPKIPMALIIAGAGISFGHSSEPGNLCLGEVCKMLIKYIDLIKDKKVAGNPELLYRKLAKYMLPDFPIYQLIRNCPELVKAYKKSDFSKPIYIDGSMEIHPDHIRLRTLPYGINPRDVWKAIGEAHKSNKPNFINTNVRRVEDYSKDLHQCDVTISLKRGVDVFEVLDGLKKFVGFTQRWKPRYLFILTNGRVDYVDPLLILDHWYEERLRHIKSEMVSGQHKITEQMRVVEALIKIGSRIKEVVNLLLNTKSNDEAVEVLCGKYGLNKTQALAILDYKLANIPKQSHAALLERMRKAKEKLASIQNNFIHTADAVAEDAHLTMKKFPQYVKRNSNGPQFVGAIIFHNGFIQFDSIKELAQIAGRFPAFRDVILYPKKNMFKLALTKKGFVDEEKMCLPKEMSAEGIIADTSMPLHTVVLSPSGRVGRVSKITGVTNKHLRVYYVGNNISVMTKDGKVYLRKTTSIPLVKDIDKPNVDSDIMCISNQLMYTDAVVAYCKKPNEIIVETLKHDCAIDVTTRTTVLKVTNPGNVISVCIPDRCRNKTSISQLVLSTGKRIGRTVINLNARKGYKVAGGLMYN